MIYKQGSEGFRALVTDLKYMQHTLGLNDIYRTLSYSEPCCSPLTSGWGELIDAVTGLYEVRWARPHRVCMSVNGLRTVRVKLRPPLSRTGYIMEKKKNMGMSFLGEGTTKGSIDRPEVLENL